MPARGACLALLAEQEVPEHIVAHSLVVADLACGLARRLAATGARLDLALVEAGALLHDIGKARALGTGRSHAETGASLLEARGLTAVAAVVRAHTSLKTPDVDGPLSESLVVNYADKRVRHDAVVALDERFADLAERYARGPDDLALLATLRNRYARLEARLFSQLGLDPTEASRLAGEVDRQGGSQSIETGETGGGSSEAPEGSFPQA